MSEVNKIEQNLSIKKIDSGTVNIQINNNEMLMSIVGQFNQHLKELEKLTNTVVFFRGNSITCKGKASNLEDFSKAMALGADAIAVSNSAMQAVGCIAARMCNSNNCPVGVATQKPELRKMLDVQIGSEKLARYFEASVELMQVLARACGHKNLSDFNYNDITTWKREMAELSGIKFAGVMR